jgi:LPXTG-motif cell wall-anchored protein
LKPEDVKVHVENKSQTKLPFTGGTGTMLTIIIAIGAITIGTAAIAIDKKRRAV